MRRHKNYNIFDDDAIPQKKKSTRLHGEGIETTPHIFGSSDDTKTYISSGKVAKIQNLSIWTISWILKDLQL